MKRLPFDPLLILAIFLLVAGSGLLIGCGGGGEDQPTPEPTEYRLEVLPATSSYQGNIEVCPAPWIAPRNMIITATLDYAPNMTVYRNYRPVDSLPVSVAKGDSILVCATMPAPLTIYSGTVTIKEVQVGEQKQTIQPVDQKDAA
jgi:hypothetical protein